MKISKEASPQVASIRQYILRALLNRPWICNSLSWLRHLPMLKAIISTFRIWQYNITHHFLHLICFLITIMHKWVHFLKWCSQWISSPNLIITICRKDKMIITHLILLWWGTNSATSSLHNKCTRCSLNFNRIIYFNSNKRDFPKDFLPSNRNNSYQEVKIFIKITFSSLLILVDLNPKAYLSNIIQITHNNKLSSYNNSNTSKSPLDLHKKMNHNLRDKTSKMLLTI